MGPCMQLSLSCPSTDKLTLGGPISTEETQAAVLGYDEKIRWTPSSEKVGRTINFPSIAINKLPSK